MSEHTPEFSNPFNLSDAAESLEVIEAKQKEWMEQLQALDENAAAKDKAALKLRLAETQVALNQGSGAWNNAREALDVFLAEEDWQQAVEACDVLYQSGQSASIKALGHGLWLAVTFPVDPKLSFQLLEYVVEETPDQADGAAVAAVAAKYIIDLRADEKTHQNLGFLAEQMVFQVAQRHSQVRDQDGLNAWLDRLGLREPRIFLPRLSLVVGALVEEDWWFDRDALREKIPQD